MLCGAIQTCAVLLVPLLEIDPNHAFGRIDLSRDIAVFVNAAFHCLAC